jgi:tetratricopeptide (TPR) repeat protein
MKTTMRMAAVLAALLATGLLYADATARLKGTVTDSGGHPLEGVTVLVTSPNLLSFKMTLRSDKSGRYSLILNDGTLPYHVRFEKESYVSADADKKVPVGETGVVDMKLLKTSEAQQKAGSAPAAAAVPSASNEAILAFNSGVDSINAGDKTGAEAHYLEAVQKNPDLSAGWQALTILAFEKKDWAKTLEYGRKTTDLDPSLTDLYPLLAEASKQTGDKKAAADWAARAAEANPAAAADGLYKQGIEAYNKGKMKDAEAALSKAVEAKPDFANAQFWLGMASFNLNKKAAAKEHLSKYLELEPNGKEAATAKEILPLLK